jgi:hypothetical protein
MRERVVCNMEDKVIVDRALTPAVGFVGVAGVAAAIAALAADLLPVH